MRRLAVLLLLPLSGCATSMNALGQDAVDLSIPSTYPTSAVAACLATWLNGQNPIVTVSPDHYIITRNNGYGFPAVRWDITTTSTGSLIERRTRLNINNGNDKARQCAANPTAVTG